MCVCSFSTSLHCYWRLSKNQPCLGSVVCLSSFCLQIIIPIKYVRTPCRSLTQKFLHRNSRSNIYRRSCFLLSKNLFTVLLFFPEKLKDTRPTVEFLFVCLSSICDQSFRTVTFKETKAEIRLLPDFDRSHHWKQKGPSLYPSHEKQEHLDDENPSISLLSLKDVDEEQNSSCQEV